MFKKAMVYTLMLGSVFLLGCQNMQSNLSKNSTDINQHEISKNAEAVSMMSHLQAFQRIATHHDGNRAVGTSGGQASAKYIIEQAQKMGFTAQMIPFENREGVVGQNIMVEVKGQSKDTAVILGGHYDSVKMGPGINDNASGVAVLLALLQRYQKQEQTPKHTLYFAFWDSEEVGLGGSQAFVKTLSPEKLKQIKAYINLDMVGTKNPEVMIADADKSSIDEMEKTLKESGMAESDYKPLTDSLRQIPNHVGDLALEKHLKEFFKQKGLQVREDVSTLTASDTLPFLGKVPVTSIIMFNEQLKGDELEFAPCYHKACDQIDLIDEKSLNLTKDAVIFLLENIQ